MKPEPSTRNTCRGAADGGAAGPRGPPPPLQAATISSISMVSKAVMCGPEQCGGAVDPAQAALIPVAAGQIQFLGPMLGSQLKRRRRALLGGSLGALALALALLFGCVPAEDGAAWVAASAQ